MFGRVRIRKWLFLALALFAGAATARTLELEARRISTAVARVEALALSIDWKAGAATGALKLDAALVDAGELGYAFRDVGWRCELRRHSATHYECDGAIRARNRARANLKVEWRDGELTVALTQGNARLAFEQPKDAMRIVAAKLPAAWLQPVLERAWNGGTLTEGALGAELALKTSDTGLWLSGPVELAGLGLDSRDGSIAAAGLNARGKFSLALEEKATRLDLGLDFRGGELLFRTFYASLPETPVRLDLAMRGSGAAWEVESLAWRDPGVLDLSARLQIDTHSDAPLRRLDAKAGIDNAAVAIPRYADSLLGMGGLSGLKAEGKLKAEVELEAEGFRRVHLVPEALDLIDPAGRFDVAGLGGDITLSAGEVAIPGQIRWRRAHVHGIELGPAQHAVQSRRRGLELARPATLDVLGGQVKLARLSYAPDVQGEAIYDLAMTLAGLDLARLSAGFGWPAFPGALSGEVSGLRYADEVLELQGGLAMALFDGSVKISALRMERPFGVAPTLSASIEIANLDLAPLTGAFGFGQITGRLEGRIRDLRLVDWSPVAFDAYLQTSASAKDRRISQRAVTELTNVGGGGLAAGLQGTVLKAFSSFGYRQIGLGCTLANDVCAMRGLPSKDEGGGYTIVDGSGLPRVNVVGHQKKVDWPVLLGRLKAAVSGQQSPVFE